VRILIAVAGNLLLQGLACAEPPPFKLMRFDEDYAYLSDPSKPGDLDDRLKFIPFGQAGYVSLGGEWRERYDSIGAERFGIGGSADHFVLQRLMLHADIHFNDRVRVFAQLGRGDAYRKSGPLGPSDEDRGDIQNLFIDFLPDPGRHLTLRIGRQEIAFNATQRFVSVREGPNVRQSFDGLRALWVDTAWHAQAFATRPVAYKVGSFDDSADRNQRFDGVDVSYAFSATQALEGYVLDLERERVGFGSIVGDERRHSFGLRWAGTSSGFDHDVEGIYQTGSFSGREIRAWAVGMIAGYTAGWAGKPRVGLEFDAGSGDRHPSDGRLETFNPMFPKGAYFNESSLTSWANLVLLRASLSLQPTARTSVSASVGERWRETGADAVYLQPYIAIAPTLQNHERRVGEIYQLDASWRANRYFTLSAQALRQSAGPAIRDAGGRAVNFTMLLGQAKF
jgi:hypothetical protein